MATRRTFLAGSAALAVSPLVGMRFSRASAAAPGKKLGVALCGLGKLSTNQIAPALLKTVHCRLAGVITGTPAKAVRWKSRYGLADENIYSYETMHRMVDNPDIDVVYVVTPNALHLDNALVAAKAGKHVFCEKPMEISAERCRQMIDAVSAANRLLGVAYRLHFEPHNLECVRIARSGEIGPLKMIDAHFGFPIEPNVWRLNRALAGGGPLMDVGIYCLQATRYLTGDEPLSVTASLTRGNDARFSEVEESVSWQATFPGGVLARCGTSYDAAPAAYFRALGERGWIALDPAFTYDGIRGTRSNGRAIGFPPVDQFAAELDDFAACILHGKPTRVPGEEGLRDLTILEAIYEAARTGKTINL